MTPSFLGPISSYARSIWAFVYIVLPPTLFMTSRDSWEDFSWLFFLLAPSQSLMRLSRRRLSIAFLSHAGLDLSRKCCRCSTYSIRQHRDLWKLSTTLPMFVASTSYPCSHCNDDSPQRSDWLEGMNAAWNLVGAVWHARCDRRFIPEACGSFQAWLEKEKRMRKSRQRSLSLALATSASQIVHDTIRRGEEQWCNTFWKWSRDKTRSEKGQIPIYVGLDIP